MKQYNDKYINVNYENKNWRLYNENETTSLDALYSETQIKLIELIEKYNFKIFYFNCKPATNNKLIIDNQIIDLETKDVEKIKLNQLEDFYYIYENQLCEIFYSFLKLDPNNNYYFDFMLVVNKDFKINSIYNHNFKTVNIESVKEINFHELTFELIQNIFKSRVITVNNCVPIQEKEFYNLNELNYSFEDYLKNYKNGSLNFDDREYSNFNSFYFYNNFDQNRCAAGMFKLLCSQIWSIDRYFYKEKNKFGFRITYGEKYDLNSSFITNFAELVNCYSYSLEDNKTNLKKEYFTYSCLSDNFMGQGILQVGFNIEYLKNNKIDFNNLKIVEIYE